MNDPRQEQQNVDSDQVATQPVAPTASQVPAANETDSATPLYDGMQKPAGEETDPDAEMASHNVFDQNQTATTGSTENVIPVDGDDPAAIEEALKKHHEAHGA